MICPNCGTANPDAAKFCMACGNALQATCPACSTTLPEGARFCFNCGHEIDEGSTSGMEGVPAQQVTRRLAESIGRQPHGERRTITLMFCDVTGSTVAAERLDPEDWAEIMRGAFDRFFAPVERYGGTVARMLGDAILAYFGAPVAHEDDPERAVLAGLAIRDSLAAYAEEVRSKHGIDFGVRVGINTGLVVVGELGTESRSEYTALGDAANLAARMEQTARPGTVRIAEATHRQVAPLFEFSDVGPIEVKGKSAPVRAYEVIGRRAERGRLRGIEGLTAPLIGRDAELDRLLSLVGDLRNARGSLASIIGDAGLGKSRLAAEVRSRVLADGGIRWHQGRALSYDVETPFAPVTDLLNDMCEIGAEQSATARRSTLEAHADELLGEAAAAATPYLASLLGLPPTPEESEVLRFLEPPVLRQRAFAAAVDLIRAAALRTPTVVVFEDLHWADESSIELVETLLPVTSRAPLLILSLLRPNRGDGSWRVHETAGREHFHRYTTIELHPLDEGQSSELVRSLLAVEGIPPSLRQGILDKSEGNPFFVEEVIRSLLDAGVVVREGDRWVATAEVTNLAVPGSLAAVVQTRLDALEPQARRVLQAAAVAGRDFGVDILAELTDLGTDIGLALETLQRRELIIENTGSQDRTYAFRHAITRDVAYSTLLVSTRRDFHRLAGKWIEERHPDRVNDLARHFLEAEEPDRALPYVVASGDRSWQAFSIADAIRYYRTALEIFQEGDPIDLARRAYEGLGGSLAFAGDVPAALSTYRDMISFGERAGHDPTRVSGLNKLAMTQALFLGEMAEAEQQLLNAKSVAEASNDLPGLAEFHMVYCSVNTLGGHLDKAASHLADAAELGEVMQSSAARCFGLTHYANTLVFLTRFDEAMEAAKEAEKVATENGERQFQAELYGETFPLVSLIRGELEEALGYTTRGIGIAREIGAMSALGMATYVAAKGEAMMGRFEDATAHYEEAAEMGTMTGFVGLTAAANAGLATVHQSLNGPGSPALDAIIEKARAPLGHPLGVAMAGFALSELADVALAEGATELATECLAEGMALRSTSSHLAAPDFMLCSAQMATEQGRFGDAKSLLDDAATYIGDRGMRYLEPRLAIGRALLALAESGSGWELLEDAIEQARAMGQIPLLLRAQRRGAQLAAGMGERLEAWRSAVADTVSDLAAGISDPDLRKRFLRAGAA